MRLTKLALLCGVVMLAATATLARADEDVDVAVPEIDADEGIDSGLEEVDEDISVEGAAGGKQPEMTEEQRAMQGRLQRAMIRYVLEVAEPSCAGELREVLSMTAEQQEERKAATEGRMLSEECNTEVNSKAAEFNSKLQAGEIDTEAIMSGEEPGMMPEGGEGAPAAAAPAVEDTRSTAPIVGAVLLFALALVGALYLFAGAQHRKVEKYWAEHPEERRKHEKKMKAKSNAPAE